MPSRRTTRKAENQAAKKKVATRRASALMSVLRTVENRVGKIARNVGKAGSATGGVAMNIVKNAENSIGSLVKGIRRAL
jgi:hypothetical protein